MPYVNDMHLTPGAKITKNGVQAVAIADHADTATATAAQIATKQNAILAALRGVGIIAKS